MLGDLGLRVISFHFSFSFFAKAVPLSLLNICIFRSISPLIKSGSNLWFNAPLRSEILRKKMCALFSFAIFEVVQTDFQT